MTDGEEKGMRWKAARMSFQRRMSFFKGYEGFYREWVWHWFATLTFPGQCGRVPFERANAMVKLWIRRICLLEGIQIGSFYSLCLRNKSLHIHLLMLGYGQMQDGNWKMLWDVDPRIGEREWPYLSRIEAVSSQAAVSKYVAAQFLRNEECEVDFYNSDLLQKTKIEQDLGPCIR